MSAPIAAGTGHVCALTETGGVRCWGANFSGELGNGRTSDKPGLADVADLTSGVRAVGVGSMHTCALTDAGGVKCWGNDIVQDYGRLPRDIAGLTTGVKAIAVGGQHTCVLTDVGAVKCWGQGQSGEFANPNSSESAVPLTIPGLESHVTAIAASGFHTCALTSAGGVKCWGANNYGQLGDGTKIDSPVPVDVAGLESGVTSISVGDYHTCALMDSGRVTCWGHGGYGQLGDGRAKTSKDPVAVKGLSSEVTAISAGGYHTCALMKGGSVQCWGRNRRGELGSPSFANSKTPRPVVGLASGVSAISASGETTCALSGDGRARCWGDNFYGQLGNGSTCKSSSVLADVSLVPGTPLPPAPQPFVAPAGKLAHAKGANDVLLRYDLSPDVGSGEAAGMTFQPGPEFTLYGDGTIIYRNDLAQEPEFDTILRLRGFRIAHLSETRVQSLLRYAIGKGKLGKACQTHQASDSDDYSITAIFTIHAGGLDKTVRVLGGAGPFKALAARLIKINQAGDLTTKEWAPGRYRGSLLEADALIKKGVLPSPYPDAYPWPWKGIKPNDFSGLGDLQPGRRVLSKKQAAVLGLSDKGGVVRRVYLLGPDRETIYAFSLWPMSRDEG